VVSQGNYTSVPELSIGRVRDESCTDYATGFAHDTDQETVKGERRALVLVMQSSPIVSFFNYDTLRLRIPAYETATRFR
jgi:hypothetical protein